ncbi:MAG TPA: KEOPS complex subunit Pcc1 [Candidatus Thermoplasmatota archaeon]|nr:KEOPS complex subunit Pcc1 [Candidatus Thermoplasmatota archaeon]
MSHRATLRLELGTPDRAARLAASLAPENEGFVSTRVEGATLVAEARSDTPMGLLRTLDEVVACIAAAEKADRLAQAEAPPSPDL